MMECSFLWGFSNESEHDLALMVSDFLENNGGSAGADSWCSSDGESVSPILSTSDKISYHKHSACQYDLDLLSVVHSLILSMGEADLHFVKSGPCNAISLKLYDSCRLCNFLGTLPATVLVLTKPICDMYMQLARAVDSYNQILNSLPVVYVGSPTHLLLICKQSGNRLPATDAPLEHDISGGNVSSANKQCKGHLRRLQPSLQSELEADRLLKPINIDNTRRLKHDRARRSSFRAL
ncbi:hypothetical protein GQ457_09G029660 [Hibiscus cannabinus]